MKSLFLVSIIAMVMLMACNTNEPATVAAETTTFNLDSVKAGIAASNKLYGEAFAKADSALFLDRYTSDAILMVPNMPAFNGREAINQFFKAGVNMMGVKNINLVTTNLYGQGDFVTEEGTYELFGAENASIDKGKFLVLWKKTDAGWKMYRDIFNSDVPLPGPEPEK